MKHFRTRLLPALLLLLVPSLRADEISRVFPDPPPPEASRLCAAGLLTGLVTGPTGESFLRLFDAFQARHPGVELVPATGINIPGRSMDMQPLMQIAGDVSPDVIYVNFRQSDTYIRNKFLYPLDAYIERLAGVRPEHGPFLSTDDYYSALASGPGFEKEMRARMPRPVWDVIRRECPYGEQCPYLAQREAESARVNGDPLRTVSSETLPSSHTCPHFHVWAMPQGQLVMALFYRKDVFAEAGLPDRVPETCDEFLEFARAVTNPAENTYGLRVSSGISWTALSFLYSYGGRAVVQDGETGDWRCAFNSPEAVDAYTFVARLFLEPFENRHGRIPCVVNTGDAYAPNIRYAMWFNYLEDRAFDNIDPNNVGFGPVPQGPDGMRASEYNCMMYGLYAGNVDHNPALRDLAWDFVWFIGSRTTDLIYAKTFVENGIGRFVRPAILRDAGYPDEAGKSPPGWEDAYTEALAHGVPEPYGRNCQLVYNFLDRGIDQILNDSEIKKLFRTGTYPEIEERVKLRAKEILDFRVDDANQKMLGLLPDGVRRFRNRVSAVVVVVIFAAFALVFRNVFKTFAKTASVRSDSGVSAPRLRSLAYLMLFPAVATIAVWSYWPVLRGTAMAFQNYNVRGFSSWVGLDNFSAVLFSPEFWHAMGVSVQYTILYVLFGFCAPIFLALLLSEVPRGKILFRTIYYLPAVLSGVIVIFLWKGFYGPSGLFNQLLNAVIPHINSWFGTSIPASTENWLANPRTALFCCLLPTIWAGMGPGCLIYLAALKTVPNEIYEAADIDGAGILAKVRHITLPSIRMLVLINFVGAIIGAMKSGSGFIMAMTGGGPYIPYGKTEVVGLHVFWEAFGYLRFGPATAMAWVLGSLLIGFTVFQLKRLSQMEFKTAK